MKVTVQLTELMVVAGQLDLKWTGKEAMKGKKNGDDVGQKGGF